MRYEFSVVLVFAIGQSSFAQQTVQQPVMGVTSVNTTVSVPDRGTTFMGGVSSAESGRSQYGPLRSGTSTGYSRQSTSISTHVYIIDLNEMDQAILNSTSPTSGGIRSVTNELAVRPRREPMPINAASPLEKAKKFEELARNSEKTGKTSLAKLYWEAAKKYGSNVAEKRLAELAKPLPDQSIQSAAR
jgi:hypothetical protein